LGVAYLFEARPFAEHLAFWTIPFLPALDDPLLQRRSLYTINSAVREDLEHCCWSRLGYGTLHLRVPRFGSITTDSVGDALALTFAQAVGLAALRGPVPQILSGFVCCNVSRSPAARRKN
jgi:hypothetical protein